MSEGSDTISVCHWDTYVIISLNIFKCCVCAKEEVVLLDSIVNLYKNPFYWYFLIIKYALIPENLEKSEKHKEEKFMP